MKWINKILPLIILVIIGGHGLKSQVIGTIGVQGPDGLIYLPVVTEAEAISAGHGVVKVALSGGITGAADLVLTSDPEASPIRIETTYGTRAWRLLDPDQGLYVYLYGGNSSETPFHILPTQSGGFLIGGTTFSYGAGGIDMMVLNLDDEGNVNWSNAYGYSGFDLCFAACEMGDGSFIIAGRTDAGAHNYDCDYKKLDSNGNLVWEYWSGGTGNNGSLDVIPSVDGNFILCSYTSAPDYTDQNIWLRKKEPSNAANVWGWFYDTGGNEGGNSVVQNSSGGYAIAGYSDNTSGGDDDMYFMTTNSAGNSILSKRYGGSDDEVAEDLVCDSDGNYVLAGYTYSFGQGSADCYVKKVDQNGDNIWGYAIGGTDYDRAYSIINTADNGYAVLGYSRRSNNYYNTMLVKLDNDGQIQWTWYFGGTNTCKGYHLFEGSDGSLYLTGVIYGLDAANSYETYLVKMSANGNTCLSKGINGDYVDIFEMEGMNAVRIENMGWTPIYDDEKDSMDVLITLEEKNIQSSENSVKTVTPFTPTITTICN